MTYHRYVVDIDRMPPRFFPADLDTSQFIEISEVGANWAKFMDPVTGNIHDCAVYRREALAAKGIKDMNNLDARLPETWSEAQKEKFKRFYHFWRLNQELIKHPHADFVANTHWRTIAWNAAWMHIVPPPMKKKLVVVTKGKAVQEKGTLPKAKRR